ncbi:uncharacterized protein BX663DRAFT_509411 [Cokeromyces recurvatus]|uniref:uncharacterized protein n=1 Tax=Cokeromyces recurvatus TaxID=90255 RepID=UPI00221F5585|nr:uncharacterized protein BX663DRAFT_509411 [Cokeromyces recurvatus]KAI7903056.1 hypothetical protein BX663DRAFT_509411 [Cokeromyces recurvatus]
MTSVAPTTQCDFTSSVNKEYKKSHIHKKKTGAKRIRSLKVRQQLLEYCNFSPNKIQPRSSAKRTVITTIENKQEADEENTTSQYVLTETQASNILIDLANSQQQKKTMTVVSEKDKQKEKEVIEKKKEVNFRKPARMIAIPKRSIKKPSSSNIHDPLGLLLAAAEAIHNEDKLTKNIITVNNQQERKRRHNDIDPLKTDDNNTKHPVNKKRQKRTASNVKNNSKTKPAKKENNKDATTKQQNQSIEYSLKIKRNALHAYISYMIYNSSIAQNNTPNINSHKVSIST